MALDPQIPLGVQVPQQNPMASIAFGQELASRQTQEQERQAQAAKLQQQQAEQAAIQRILQQNVDPETGIVHLDDAINALMAHGAYGAADTLKKNADAALDAEQKRIKAGLENHSAILNDLGKQAEAVRDSNSEGAYQGLITQVAKTYGPQIAAGAPTTLAAAKANGWLENAMKWGGDQQQRITRLQKETEDFNVKPDSAEAWTKHASTYLSSADPKVSDPQDPRSYQFRLGALALQRMPTNLLNQFKGLTPDQAGQVSITPEQRQQTASQAAGQVLQASGQAEQRRHNLASEGLEAQRGQSDDVKLSVQGMKNGTLPPQLPGRASKDYTAIMAEANRQGFDLAKANEDWVATQKHLSTMNGQQQERLRQAISFTKESLPLVRQLITQWDSAGYPVLSKAALDAAAAGAGTKEQQSLAVRLKGQIADLTSELGTVYKGGNSSTDESLKLAGENLSGSWSKQAALDAIDQIDKNIGFRENSMRNSRAVTSGGDNAYDRSQATSTPPADKTQVWNSPRGAMKWNGTMWVPK